MYRKSKKILIYRENNPFRNDPTSSNENGGNSLLKSAIPGSHPSLSKIELIPTSLIRKVNIP